MEFFWGLVEPCNHLKVGIGRDAGRLHAAYGCRNDDWGAGGAHSSLMPRSEVWELLTLLFKIGN